MDAIAITNAADNQAWTPFKEPKNRIVKVGNVRKDSFLLALLNELEEIREKVVNPSPTLS